MELLQTLWFLLVGVLFIGYAILDGFDLGVGVLHLFTRGDEVKRTYLNAIGPVWDGNEVWLLTGGGALFAAFPAVYATVFSGFYLALMLLLVALIFRAVSMEFRGKIDSPGWKTVWDALFGIGSLLPAVLLGVAFGNILEGIPIDEHGLFRGSFVGLLNPYAIGVGVLSLLLFVMHGAVYLTMKTDDGIRAKNAAIAGKLWYGVVALYVVMTIVSTRVSPTLVQGLGSNVLAWLVLIVLVLSTVMVPVALRRQSFFQAFLASSGMIAGMIGISAVSLFPKLVPSSISPEFSLTVGNASSSELTLTVMLVMALIGMPLVIGYSVFIHRVFRGKVEITPESY